MVVSTGFTTYAEVSIGTDLICAEAESAERAKAAKAPTKANKPRIGVSWSVPRNLGVPDDAKVVPRIVYGGELVRDDALSTPTYW